MITSTNWVFLAAWTAFASWSATEYSLITLRLRTARWIWTLGFAALAIHIALAFQFFHHWSHAAAIAATAEQTADVTGLRWGGGVWVNYTLLMVWAIDMGLAWRKGETQLSRPSRRILRWTMGFLWFQGAVVFAHSPLRWVALGIFIGLGMALARPRSREQPT